MKSSNSDTIAITKNTIKNIVRTIELEFAATSIKVKTKNADSVKRNAI